MALSHTTKVYGSKRAMVYTMLTDPAGGAATYGTGVFMPGIQQVAIGGAIDAKELRGDNTFLDADAVVKNITVAITWAKFNFDIFVSMLGWSATDAGTTPNQTVTAPLYAPVSLPYFKLDVQAVSVDSIGGDFHFALPKLKLSDFPAWGTAQEDFQLQKVTCLAVPLISGTPAGQWILTTMHETAVAPS